MNKPDLEAIRKRLALNEEARPLYVGATPQAWYTDKYVQLTDYCTELLDEIDHLTNNINETVTPWCTFCGKIWDEVPKDGYEVSPEVLEHVRNCEKHPVGIEIRQLREALEGSNRIVEKYKDACMEWAKEAHHKGVRQVTEFWERRVKSMANLLVMISQALTQKEPNEEEKETPKT